MWTSAAIYNFFCSVHIKATLHHCSHCFPTENNLASPVFALYEEAVRVHLCICSLELFAHDSLRQEQQNPHLYEATTADNIQNLNKYQMYESTEADNVLIGVSKGRGSNGSSVAFSSLTFLPSHS